MAPLAGKPPFATDEPDSYYETPKAQPRLRQPKPADPNNRTSAYNVYDNYLGDDSSKLAASPAAAAGSSRNSGIGAMLLNMDDDSDDDSDDESYRRRPAAPPGIGAPLSKNAALAAATGVTSPTTPTRPSPPPQFQQQPQANMNAPAAQQMQMQQSMQQQQHQQMMMQNNPNAPNQQRKSNNPFNQPPQQMQQPIAAPRPGYAAPIAALNLARPEPAMPSPMQRAPPAPIQIPTNANDFGPPGSFGAGLGPMPASPAPSSPHPLLPPVTPIRPAFIRPTNASVVNVSFSGVDEGKATPRKPIMRGNSEETLLPSRGEKGDDFWRRFSMVVKEENKKGSAKESSWLKKTRSGIQSYSRWVWIIGIVLILLIIGGIGIGVYLTRNAPSHQQPKAIGGSADNADGGTTAAAVGGAEGAKAKSTSLHVSPTHTVARRAVEETPVGVVAVSLPTGVVRRHQQLKNREANVW